MRSCSRSLRWPTAATHQLGHRQQPGSFSSGLQTASGTSRPLASRPDVPGGFLPGMGDTVQVVALPNGSAVAAWRTYNSGVGALLQTSSYDRATGAWSTPVTLEPTDGATEQHSLMSRRSLR